MRRIVECVSGRCIGSDEKKVKEVFESVDLCSVVAVASSESIAAM